MREDLCRLRRRAPRAGAGAGARRGSRAAPGRLRSKQGARHLHPAAREPLTGATSSSSTPSNVRRLPSPVAAPAGAPSSMARCPRCFPRMCPPSSMVNNHTASSGPQGGITRLVSVLPAISGTRLRSARRRRRPEPQPVRLVGIACGRPREDVLDDGVRVLVHAQSSRAGELHPYRGGAAAANPGRDGARPDRDPTVGPRQLPPDPAFRLSSGHHQALPSRK